MFDIIITAIFSDPIKTISTFFFIVFGVIAIIQRNQNKKLKMAVTNFDWGQMLVAASVVSRKMAKKKFSPDLILAIHGGGGIFANLLSIELGEKIPLHTIHILPKPDRQDDDNNILVMETTKWKQFIPRNLKQYSNQKVVIVDDFCISGSTLQTTLLGLEKLGFAKENIKKAAAVCTQGAKDDNNATDFEYFVVVSRMVDFPWGPGEKLRRMGLMS